MRLCLHCKKYKPEQDFPFDIVDQLPSNACNECHTESIQSGYKKFFNVKWTGFMSHDRPELFIAMRCPYLMTARARNSTLKYYHCTKPEVILRAKNGQRLLIGCNRQGCKIDGSCGIVIQDWRELPLLADGDKREVA